MSTRFIWMSRSYASCPSPTVKSGTPDAWSGSSASPSPPSALSAPSVTTTRPDSGTPDNSSCARSSAWPICVREPSYSISSTAAIRSVSDENRKKRSAKRSASGGPQRALRRPQFLPHERVPRRLVAVRDLHAARVVNQDAEEVFLRHDGGEHQHRAKQAEGQHRERGDADPGQHGAVQRLAVAAHLEVGTERQERPGRRGRHRQEAEPRRAERECALIEDQRPVLEQKLE